MERKELQLPLPIIRLFASLAKCDPSEISKEIFRPQENQIGSNIPSELDPQTEIEETKIDDEANRKKVIDDIREAYEKLADVKAVWENQMRGREETEEKERERRAYYRKIYKDQIRKNLEKLQAEIKAKVNAEFKAKARIEAEAKARIQAERKRKKTESELMEIKKNRIPQFCRYLEKILCSDKERFSKIMESGHLLIESWEEQLQLTPDQVIVQNELSDTLLPIIGKATEYLRSQEPEESEFEMEGFSCVDDSEEFDE